MDSSNSSRATVIALYNEGLTQRTIAERVNLSQSSVSRLIRRHVATGSTEANRRGRCGRKLALDERTARKLRRESLIKPRATAKDIQTSVGGRASEVSISTIKRSLVKSGRISYRPVKSPSWTPAQMRTRLRWALDHQDWTVEQWKKVSQEI